MVPRVKVSMKQVKATPITAATSHLSSFASQLHSYAQSAHFSSANSSSSSSYAAADNRLNSNSSTFPIDKKSSTPPIAACTVEMPNCKDGLPSLAVTVTCSAVEIDDWISANNILNAPAVGFDIEWKPQYQKGQTNKLALIQISIPTAALIIQTHYLDYFPRLFIEVMNSKSVLKVGVGLYQDLLRLQTDYNISFRGYLDLGMAKDCFVFV